MNPGKLHIAAALLLTISQSCCTCLSKDSAPKKEIHKTEKPPPEIPPPGIPLPPGSADLQGRMQDFSEKEDSYECKVKISQVNAYGPATPPLPPGYVITLYVPKSLLEKNNYEASKIFLRGKLLEVSVRYQGAVPMADSSRTGNSSERWIATGFSNLTQ